MTKARRVGDILIGILIFGCGVLLIIFPKPGKMIITSILGISLTIYGIRLLIYYFTMAKHMVGGRAMFYQGVIVLDLGLFTGSLGDIPLLYIVLYLAAIHGFSGVIDVLRALEAKRFEAGSWKLNMTQGAINIILALLCLVFLSSTRIAVTIYGIGLMYSAVMRIITALRRSAIVYVA